MKKLSIFLISVFLLSISINSQTLILPTDLSKEKNSEFLEAIKSVSKTEGIPFPTGSLLYVNNDGSYNIVLPENKSFVLKSGLSRALNGVTCSCDGGGCSPVVYKEKFYCVMSSCSVCSMSSPALIQQSKGVISESDSAIKFVVDEFSKNDIAKSIETNDYNYSFLDSNIFINKDVIKNLNDFYYLIYEGKIPDFIIENKLTESSDYKYVKVSICGYLALIPVPNTDIFVSYKAVSKYSCVCSDGTGCVKDSFLGAVYCDAGGCSKCGLTNANLQQNK
jgi:hypothetical protein